MRLGTLVAKLGCAKQLVATMLTNFAHVVFSVNQLFRLRELERLLDAPAEAGRGSLGLLDDGRCRLVGWVVVVHRESETDEHCERDKYELKEVVAYLCHDQPDDGDRARDAREHV